MAFYTGIGMGLGLGSDKDGVGGYLCRLLCHAFCVFFMGVKSGQGRRVGVAGWTFFYCLQYYS
jgi:hypothetical protein